MVVGASAADGDVAESETGTVTHGASAVPCASRAETGARGRSTRDIVKDQLASVVGDHLDEKPRPFKNALGLWGAGSCFINASLQLLFASENVQRTLAEYAHGVAGGRVFAERV